MSFDIFMGKGTYPRLWVAPELQAVDIVLELVLTTTQKVDLLENIQVGREVYSFSLTCPAYKACREKKADCSVCLQISEEVWR